MKTFISTRLFALALSTLVVAACDGGGTTDAGSDAADRVTPTDIVQNDTQPSDGGDVLAADVVGDDADDAGDASTDVPTDTVGCEGDGGCWACPPTNDHQFLNQCTASQCSHFDNARVTRLLADGGLPPLP